MLSYISYLISGESVCGPVAVYLKKKIGTHQLVIPRHKPDFKKGGKP